MKHRTLYVLRSGQSEEIEYAMGGSSRWKNRQWVDEKSARIVPERMLNSTRTTSKKMRG